MGSWLESIQPRFELSTHLSVIFFSREALRAVNCHGKKIQRKVWKIQNTTGRFLAQLYRSNFVLKILFLVPKVSNS